MIFHIVLNALLRAFADSPLYGTNEVASFWYMPIVVLLGLAAAQIQKEQITVTLVTGRMHTRTAAIFTLFGCTVGGLLSVVLAWLGLEEAVSKMDLGATAGVTAITTWPVYFVVPIAFLLLAVIYVVDFLEVLKTRNIERVGPVKGNAAPMSELTPEGDTNGN